MLGASLVFAAGARAEATGRIYVKSEPRGARVFLDDEELPGAKTPCLLRRITVGTHLLRARLDGWVDVAREVEVGDGVTARAALVFTTRAEGEAEPLKSPEGTGTPPAGRTPGRAASAAPAEAAIDPERLATFFKGFDVHLDARDFAAAKQYASRAARASSGETKTAIESAGRIAGLLEARQQTIHASLAARLGAQVEIRTVDGLRTGKVLEVTDAGPTLAVQIKSGPRVLGESRLPIPWAKLTKAQEDRYASKWKPGGEDGAVARALLATVRGDADRAEKELGAAGEGAIVDYVRGRIETRRLARGESSARAAWAMIERWSKRKELSVVQARKLLDLVEKFEGRFAASALATSKAAEIAAAKSLARRIIVAAGAAPGSAEFGDHRYKLYRYPMRWTRAKAFCERLGGHLVTIGAREENDFVVAMARKGNANLWIGITDQGAEGTWRWVTGEQVAFTSWAPGRPNGGEGPWGLILGRHGGAWDNVGRKEMHFFICEWDPGARGTRPARSASEDPFEIPPGHKKRVLYRRDFEEDKGTWLGTIVKDPKSGGNVLRLADTPRDQHFPVRTEARPRGGLRATAKARLSFRYRTDGQFTFVYVNTHLRAGDHGSGFSTMVPGSAEWAVLDMPFSELNPSKLNPGERVTDLSAGFHVAYLGVYAGRLIEKGACFIDDYVIYEVVPGR